MPDDLEIAWFQNVDEAIEAVEDATAVELDLLSAIPLTICASAA